MFFFFPCYAAVCINKAHMEIFHKNLSPQFKETVSEDLFSLEVSPAVHGYLSPFRKGGTAGL